MTLEILDIALGQTQQCGRIKLVNHGIPMLRSSQLDLQEKILIKFDVTRLRATYES